MTVKDAKYRRHRSWKRIALDAVRILLGAALLFYSVTQMVRALRTGEIEVPLRGTNLIVTTDDPGWFAVTMFVWLMFGALFALITLVFGKQLFDELRR